VTLVNESDEYLTFHVWLVATTADTVGMRELNTVPNIAVTLTPHETRQTTYLFQLELKGWSEDESLQPGNPTELQLIEDGSKGRKLVIS
jgi:hypothetical protein